MQLKSKLLVLTLSLAFVLVPSSLASARQFEFVGGAFYTTLALNDLNSAIEDLNKQLKELEEEEGVSVTEMDEINGAIGYFAGSRFNLGNGLSLGGTYEAFSAGTGTEIDYKDEDTDTTLEIDLDIDLSVNGLVGTLRTDITDYIGLNAGGGYYFGTVSMTGKMHATGEFSDDIPDFEETDSADISGFGFKAGGSFNYPLNNQISLYSTVNYRMLGLEAEEDNDLTNDTSLNANGMELRMGVSFAL